MHRKESICVWKRLSVNKMCGLCQYMSLYFCGEPQGGDFSLSPRWLSEIEERERAQRMCKDVEKGLEMILFPPPLPLSLLSQVWNFKKAPQSEHTPCQNVLRCKIVPQIFPVPSSHTLSNMSWGAHSKPFSTQECKHTTFLYFSHFSIAL